MLLRPGWRYGNGFGLCKKQMGIGNAAQRYGHGQGHSQQSPKKHTVFIKKECHYTKNGKAHGHIHILVPAEFYYRSAFKGIGVKNTVISYHEEGIDDKDKGQRADKEGKDDPDIAAAGIENQKRNGNGQQYPDGQEGKGMDADKGLVGQHEPCRSIGEDKKRHKEQGARVQHVELIRAEAFRKSLRELGKAAGTVEKYRQQECSRQPHGVLVMDAMLPDGGACQRKKEPQKAGEPFLQNPGKEKQQEKKDDQRNGAFQQGHQNSLVLQESSLLRDEAQNFGGGESQRCKERDHAQMFKAIQSDRHGLRLLYHILPPLPLHPVLLDDILAEGIDVVQRPVEGEGRRGVVQEDEEQRGHAVELYLVAARKVMRIEEGRDEVHHRHQDGQDIDAESADDKELIRRAKVADRAEGNAVQGLHVGEQVIRGKEEGYLQKHADAGAKGHELAVAVLAVQRGYHGEALLPLEHLAYHAFHGGHAGLQGAFLFLPAFHLVVDGQDDRVHGKAHQDEGKAIGRRSVKAPAQNDLHTEFKRGDADKVEEFQHGPALSIESLPSFSFRKAGLGFYIPRGKRTYFSSGESG